MIHWDSVLQFLVQQFHNQFLSGGLVLMLTGSVIALLRKVPDQIFRWVKRRVTVEVEITNADPLFDFVTLWLNAHPYSRRSRKLIATLARNSYGEDSPPQRINDQRAIPEVLYSPAPGSHIFLYDGKLIWLDRERESTGVSGTSGALKKRESYTFTVLGRDQHGIREMIGNVVSMATTPTDTIGIFRSHFGCWERYASSRPRKLDSVVLPFGQVDRILNDIKAFMVSTEWYRSVGIPWHRGYLLWGKPGTGKSSLVVSLAGELGMDLYLLNIGGTGMDDERLENLMSEVRPGTIVLMEDVDCTFPDRDDKDRKGVTLSGLLNCLDGIQSRDGCVLFMTTNRRGVLDSALTRPGRVDMELEFDIATLGQIQQMRDRLAPGYGDLNHLIGKTMAEVQQFFIDRRRDFRAL